MSTAAARTTDKPKTGAENVRWDLSDLYTGIDDPAIQHHYCRLDDSDVLYSLKVWSRSSDPIIADLARRFVDRDFLRVQFLSGEPDEDFKSGLEHATKAWMTERGLVDPATSEANPHYYLGFGHSRHSAYLREGSPIAILDKSGVLRELSDVADTSAIAALSRPVTKPYVFGPKKLV